MLMNCGDSVQPRPVLGPGSCTGWGPRTESARFHRDVPQRFPIKDAENWQSGFLPGVYQGTFVDPQHGELEKLIENIRSPHASLVEQRRQLDLLKTLNEEHRDQRGDPRLDARIQSFELAFRMQTEARMRRLISRKSPAHVQARYGDGVHGRQTLIARRLLERGVRYGPAMARAGQPWDNLAQIESNHRKLAGEIDGPISALIRDLKERGMFERLWSCGRRVRTYSTVELRRRRKEQLGRDHNH